MLKIKLLFQVVRLLIVFGVTLSPLAVGGETAALTWYTGGNTRLALKPIAVDASSNVLLAGSTSQKTLMVQVAKGGGRSRSNVIPLAADGTFNVRYLIKDGAGSYTITFFGSEQRDARSYQGLGTTTVAIEKHAAAKAQEHELNARVLEFVDKVMGTTVGRGECWDLAQKALDLNLADWERPTNFGIPVNIDSNDIKAGDIIQFRKLTTTEHLANGAITRETLGLPDHTAILYKILGKKQYILAHQNVRGIRRVIKSEINLAHVTGGTYRVYRPVALMIPQ